MIGTIFAQNATLSTSASRRETIPKLRSSAKNYFESWHELGTLLSQKVTRKQPMRGYRSVSAIDFFSKSARTWHAYFAKGNPIGGLAWQH